jgi:phosphatidate cytidylyltransferase
VGSDEAFDLVLFTLLLVWASDIFAFYVGRAVGRHALAPRISPNKTWEGAVGGLVAAAGIAVAFKLTVGAFVGWGHVAALAVIGGVLGPFGDLAESHLKRASEVDDSSSILPGHGGVLDRFDTMALVAPLVYLYLAYIARLVA